MQHVQFHHLFLINNNCLQLLITMMHYLFFEFPRLCLLWTKNFQDDIKNPKRPKYTTQINTICFCRGKEIFALSIYAIIFSDSRHVRYMSSPPSVAVAAIYVGDWGTSAEGASVERRRREGRCAEGAEGGRVRGGRFELEKVSFGAFWVLYFCS